MEKKKSNKRLVEELIDKKWTMNQDEFESKFASLNDEDRSEVAAAIYSMEDEFMNGSND